MAVQTPILDIAILDTHNETTLLVADASNYPVKFVPVSPSLEIKVPGYPEKVMPFDPGNMMLFTSLSLGLNCNEDCPSPLPDGLYRFKYSVSPAYKYSIEKYYLRTEAFSQKFDGAFIKLSLLQCDEELKRKDREALTLIDFYLQGAIAAANRCNQKQAIDLYTKASASLDAYLHKTC